MRDVSKLIRYFAYGLELFILYILQETPGIFPEIFGARPVLLICAVISISMFEPEVASMAFGIAGGLLMDIGYGGLFGLYAITMAIICFVISVMFKLVLRESFGTAIITAIFCIMIVMAISWLFNFIIPGYSNMKYALTHKYLPRYLYTLILFPLIFLLNRGISRGLTKQE